MILQNYALNRSDPQYLSCVSSMENLQIREANGTVYPQALPRIIGSNIKNNNNNDNNYHPPCYVRICLLSGTRDVASFVN
jgi:hypothetical protein